MSLRQTGEKVRGSFLGFMYIVWIVASALYQVWTIIRAQQDNQIPERPDMPLFPGHDPRPQPVVPPTPAQRVHRLRELLDHIRNR